MDALALSAAVLLLTSAVFPETIDFADSAFTGSIAISRTGADFVTSNDAC